MQTYSDIKILHQLPVRTEHSVGLRTDLSSFKFSQILFFEIIKALIQKKMFNLAVLLCFLVAVATVSSFHIASTPRVRSNALSMADKSKALPFMAQPPNLVGLVGDVGEYYLNNLLARVSVRKFYWKNPNHTIAPLR